MAESLITGCGETDVQEAVKTIPGHSELETAEKRVRELADFMGVAVDIFDGSITYIGKKNIDNPTALKKIYEIKAYINKEIHPKIVDFCASYNAWQKETNYEGAQPLYSHPAPYLGRNIMLRNILRGLEKKLLEEEKPKI